MKTHNILSFRVRGSKSTKFKFKIHSLSCWFAGYYVVYVCEIHLPIPGTPIKQKKVYNTITMKQVSHKIVNFCIYHRIFCLLAEQKYIRDSVT